MPSKGILVRLLHFQFLASFTLINIPVKYFFYSGNTAFSTVFIYF